MKITLNKWLGIGGALAVISAIALYASAVRCGPSIEEARGFQFPPVSAVGGIPVFDVTKYGAVGNGSTDNTTAFHNAVAAATAAGGGIIFIPCGTFIVGEYTTTLRAISLSPGVNIMGASRTCSVIKLKNSQRASVRLIYVASGTTDVYIWNLTLDGNKAGQSGADEHGDLIFTDHSNRVTVREVTAHDGRGSGIVVWQNSTDTLIDHCYIYNNDWQGIAFGDAGGQNHTTVQDTRVTGNHGGLHIEISTPDNNDILFERGYADASVGNYAVEIAGNGGPPAHYANHVVVRDMQIVGPVLVVTANSIVLEGNTITCTDPTIVNSPNNLPALTLSSGGNLNDVYVVNNVIRLGTGAAGAYAVWIAGNGVTIVDNVHMYQNTIYVDTNATGVSIHGAGAIWVEDNHIVGNSTVTSNYGVDVNLTLDQDMLSAIVRNNYIVDFTDGIATHAAASTIKLHDADVSGNIFQALTPGVMTGGILFEGDTRSSILSAMAIGNRVLDDAVATIARYPSVPLLISGDRQGVAGWSVNGTPEGAITAPIGSYALRRDGSGTTSSYIKQSGTGNTGWLPAAAAITTAGTNLTLTGQSIATITNPTFSNAVIIGSQHCHAGTPTVNNGTLGTGSTNCMGNITGIGSNTSVTLTYGGATNGYTTRSWCHATANSTSVALESIVAVPIGGSVTFNCFSVATQLAANCDDFTYYCQGQ